MINVDFSADMGRITTWARRMGIELRHSVQLSEPYMFAQQNLLRMAELLVDFHGFRSVEPADPRILFALVRDDPATSLSAPPGHVIELPIHATSFFSPDRRLQWEYVFHSSLWCDRVPLPGANAVEDLFHFLQCLIPGMFVDVEDHDGWSTQRGIPPLHWIREHKDLLVTSVGRGRYAALCKAASDVKNAVIDSRDDVEFSD